MSPFWRFAFVLAVFRFARLIGIVLIFSVVGPLAIAALMSLIVVVFGAALLQMLLVLVDLDALRAMVSIAVWLLAFATVRAASFRRRPCRTDIRARLRSMPGST